MSQRGVEKVNEEDLLFAEYATTMPDIAKLDAYTNGYVAYRVDDYAFEMEILDDIMEQDMADTMEWMAEAGLVEEYSHPDEDEGLEFTVTDKLLNELAL